MNKKYILLLGSFISVACLGVNVKAQTIDSSDLAQELTNPIADLMTIPVQVNVDRNIGLNDVGRKTTINIQPVVPFKVGEDWNLITRTIVPLVKQKDIFPGAGSQSGVGDITLQLFLSPRKPTSSGVIWGGGAVFLLPTASDSLIGAKKWGAGPAGVALKLSGPWTYGALANHVWSFAGDDERTDINNSFMQPFLAYTWPSAWTVSLQSETNYNWELEEWSIPVNVAVAKLVFLGKLPVSLQAGVGRWLETPDTGPEGWRFRLQANIVLPK